MQKAPQGAFCFINNCMFERQSITCRASQTHEWCPSDSLEAYKNKNGNGPNYSKTAFNYKFNSDGYRCDEFSTPSDLPILFMGCSMTEGIGLPLNEVWPHYILTNIRNLPQNLHKNIPFKTLAIGGSGIDFAARSLNQYVDKIKPKYIIMLMSSIYRREFAVQDTTMTKFWLPNQPSPLNGAPKVYTDFAYALYESYKSLTIINLIARLYNIKVFLFELSCDTLCPLEYQQKLIKYLPNITWIRIKDNVENESIPDNMKYLLDKPVYARDNMHSGAVWQYQLSRYIWKNIEYGFLSKVVQNKIVTK